MPRYLLIGAGFSRNWGGWLASDVTQNLSWQLRERPAVGERLGRLGFEAAFFELYSDYSRDPAKYLSDIAAFQRAILSTFSSMNRSFLDIDFEINQNVGRRMTNFLSGFDAIFTLNQDLLLELHYFPENTELRRWAGMYFPGIPGDGRPLATSLQRAEFIKSLITVDVNAVPTVHADSQPIFKLHGSSNWYEGFGHDQPPLLVIGGNKENTINAKPILRSYGERFEQSLIQRDALLMTIGYGFNDAHINQTIIGANNANTNFGIYIVDPAGRAVLDKRDQHAQIPQPQTDLMQLRYVGGSARALRETFATENVELEMLFDFFK
jgi:hypothetical protein